MSVGCVSSTRSARPRPEARSSRSSRGLSRRTRFHATSARNNGIGVAGIEFVVRSDGERVVYDVNTNTNYNAEAEQAAGKSGMGAIAQYLGRLLTESAARWSTSGIPPSAAKRCQRWLDACFSAATTRSAAALSRPTPPTPGHPGRSKGRRPLPAVSCHQRQSALRVQLHSEPRAYNSSASASTNVLAYKRLWFGIASDATASTMNNRTPNVSTPTAAAASE